MPEIKQTKQELGKGVRQAEVIATGDTLVVLGPKEIQSHAKEA